MISRIEFLFSCVKISVKPIFMHSNKKSDFGLGVKIEICIRGYDLTNFFKSLIVFCSSLKPMRKMN